MTDGRTLRRRIGWTLLAVWAVLFLGGAIGELFGVPALRHLTDVKSLFLR